MGAVVSVSALALLFLIMGIFLICGKGSWLIAGFNTASAEEKAKYNKKKLCRVMGITCLIIFTLLVVMAYLGYRVETGMMDEDKMVLFAVAFIAVVVGAVVFDSYYVNKKCRK